MDLFSQAEHDELAQSILLCPDADFIDQVAGEHRAAAADDAAPRRHRRARSKDRGALIKSAIWTRPAPSPTASRRNTWNCRWPSPQRWAEKIRHAGAIFMGRYTSESLGDYCAGPNHVLPTSRTARFSSPLGVYDFQKRTSLIQVSAGRRADAGPRSPPTLARRRRPAGACAFGGVSRLPQMSRYWSAVVHGLTPYVPGEQPKLPNLVKLNTNENPYGPSPRVLEALRARGGRIRCACIPIRPASG